jgi:hypothetical protein
LSSSIPICRVEWKDLSEAPPADGNRISCHTRIKVFAISISGSEIFALDKLARSHTPLDLVTLCLMSVAAADNGLIFTGSLSALDVSLIMEAVECCHGEVEGDLIL